jgi:hypothetical protein
MSRRACIAVLCAAIAALCSAASPVSAAPGESDGKRAEFRQKLLEKFDRNGNGQLDPDERDAAREAMQKRRDEAGGRTSGRPGAMDPELRKKLLEKFDTDGDGKLSESERAAAKAAWAARGRKADAS